MRFDDIPKFTRSSSYSIDVGIRDIERTIDRFSRHADCGIQLEPDFQRAHVWNAEQQTRFVEFLLRGGDSSRDVYWNCKGWMSSYEGPMVLVDGLQRVTAVRMFIRNEIPAFGTLWVNFDDSGSAVWDRASLKFHVNDLGTREEVLQWYIDLNAGGVAHTDEEIHKVRMLLRDERNRV